MHGALNNARYSTDNQKADSIEVQVEKCRECCHNNAIPILGVYADEATSGMKDSRPQYEVMMQQLRLGIGDTVVIYDQSRMFREMTAWFAFRDELAAMGVKVISVTQPIIGKDLRDPTNFLTEGSMALFNQIWALQSRQKTMEKMRFMARNGQHTGGKPALGYMVKDGKLEICEEEAQIVRRIFQEYADGKSYSAIIAGLNRDGLKTKRGNAFGSNSLHDLLHNEKYIGVLIYGQLPYREDGTRNTHGKASEDTIRI
jgi:site-specific DNA recombinase